MTENMQYQRWLDFPLEDPALKEELLGIKGKEEEIFDRFYQELAFGTAGLRGVLGAGTNRMNIYTVRKATQGMADLSWGLTGIFKKDFDTIEQTMFPIYGTIGVIYQLK